jgi:hypothetical protein
MTERTIPFGGRTLDLRVSAAARRALAAASAPLVVEMELYFSCLIRKRVRFPASAPAGATCVRLDDRLTLCFRPVMTRACSVSEVEGAPELETFPIRKPEAFLPKWLTLDWRHDRWAGEFGY